MDNEIQTTTYELAYHLVPDLEEAEVDVQVKELANAISQNHGTVTETQAPKKVHLSYPIKSKEYGYFGFFDFTAEAETVKKLNDQLKLHNNLLRYLLVKKPTGGKDLKNLTMRDIGKTKTKISKPTSPTSRKQPSAGQPAVNQQQTETKEMEQEIEKVLKEL